MKSKPIIVLVAISLLVVLTASDTSTATTLAAVSDNPCSGAFLDKVEYDVISGGGDEEILSLQAGSVDVLYNTIDDVHEDTLDMDPDIGLYHSYRNGYGHLTINCRDYPLNISGLRRAFAYAYDKSSIVTDVLDGKAIVHDSLVPLPNMWCTEDELPGKYYTAQPDIGNQILDDLGFTIDEGTNFRLAPNGSAFDIKVEHASPASALGTGVTQEAVDALLSLHINASAVLVDFYEAISRVDNNGEYDMLFYAAVYSDDNIDSLIDEYWSGYSGIGIMNPTHFANSTFDYWRNEFLSGTTYEEAYEAASMMQQVLQYNVPRLVVYENTYLQAARVDEFAGYVEGKHWGVGGPWTNLKVHEKSGMILGGTFTVGISDDIDTFNIFNIDEAMEELITDNLYSSLYKYGPDWKQYPDLAESILIETHDTNPAVTSGQTWVTVDIRNDANWTDGNPLTASDVAFTFQYIVESGAFGNPMASDYSDFIEAYVLGPYKVQIRLSSTSWLDIEKYMHAKIIPEHIFEDTEGIGYDGWSSWNPVFNSGDPHVTSGPFYVSNHGSGTYELSRKTDYYWPSGVSPTTTSTTSTTTNTNTTTSSGGGQFPLGNLTIIIIVGSVGIILVVIVLFIKSRR